MASLRQVAESSGLGCYVYQAALPVALDTRAVADEMKEEADKYALFGGEDYEMLFTLPEGEVERAGRTVRGFRGGGQDNRRPGRYHADGRRGDGAPGRGGVTRVCMRSGTFEARIRTTSGATEEQRKGYKGPVACAVL
ncbi:MAG: hypothetical protein U5K31_12480 [Balneolaceae bacterium]|nr:hypothetical protein [Balneolaceae bacterium]